MTQAVKERYLAQVDQALIRRLPQREQLLAEARRMVDQFAEENPEAAYEDLLAAFGPAEDFAAEMLSTVPRDQVEEAKSRRSKGRRLAGVILAVILAAVALGVAIRMYQLEQVVNGDFYVVYEPAKVITEEEAEEFFRNTPPEAQTHLKE